MSFFPAVILENFYLHSRRVILAESRGELDFAVDSVVVLDEAANESNNNDGRRFGFGGLRSRWR